MTLEKNEKTIFISDDGNFPTEERPGIIPVSIGTTLTISSSSDPDWVVERVELSLIHIKQGDNSVCQNVYLKQKSS